MPSAADAPNPFAALAMDRAGERREDSAWLIAAWPQAHGALARARQAGLTVLLVSNAPRPAASVARQLAGLGVPAGAVDGIVTSGDVTRRLFETRFRGRKVSHIGPEKDRPLVDGLPVDFVSDDEAEVCLCSGLIDDRTETPEDYRDRLAALRARGLPLVCANPDRVVETGGTLIFCAGALADLYAQLGGETIVLGKPHAPIYGAALEMAGNPDPAQVLALGDSLRTDLAGAAGQGIDCLFLTAGIHGGAFGPADDPDPDRVAAFLEEGSAPAVGWMPRLAW